MSFERVCFLSEDTAFRQVHVQILQLELSLNEGDAWQLEQRYE